MNRNQEDRRVVWAWQQVDSAVKAAEAAKAAWVASSSNVNWVVWQNAEDRVEEARRAADQVVKQVVMRNDSMRVW